jgi:transglutaminase-like putative cysteine protease
VEAEMASTTLIKNPTLDDTLRVMRTKANEARKTLRPLAVQICKGIEPGEYNSEILAVYAWVRQNVNYMRDIHDVEYVQAPARLLESKRGDCDDIACLLASLCMAIGNECRFAVIGFEDKQPSHVICQVAVRAQAPGMTSVDGNGGAQKQWVTLDPVADENTPQMHGRVGFVKIYPICSK